MSRYSLDVFPDGPQQVFPFPDGQEVAFSFVELMCVILCQNKLSKYEKAAQTSKKINTEARVHHKIAAFLVTFKLRLYRKRVKHMKTTKIRHTTRNERQT